MNVPDVFNTLDTYQKIASHPQKRSILLKDNSCVSFLIYILDDENEEVIKKAIDIFMILTEKPDDREAVVKACGALITRSLDSALSALVEKDTTKDDIKAKATMLLERTKKDRAGQPLQQLQNSYEQMSVSGTARNKSINLSTSKAMPSQLKRKNIKFMAGGGLNKARSLYFKLPRMLDFGERRYLEDNLLTIKGIISIYFDSQKSRCVLRARMDILPETIAKEILLSGLVKEVEHVYRNEEGEELTNKYCESDLKDDEKENIDPSEGPSYLSESFGESPKGKDQSGRILVTHDHHSKRQKNTGWLNSVSSFLTNSFYW